MFVQPDSIIHPELTFRLHELSAGTGLDWAASPELLAKDQEETTKRATGFRDFCERWSRHALERSPDWRKCSGPGLEELVRQPGYVADFVQIDNPRMEGSAWKEALSTFPDRHAIGRWARLIAWYALQHSIGRTHDFTNNYFDAEYAFAASYIGRLATTDQGLIGATRAVFPHVEIFDG